MSVAVEPIVQPALPRVDHALSRRLTIAAAVSASITLAIWVLFVHTALGHRFDNAVLLGSHEQETSTRLFDAALLEKISAGSFVVVLALIIGFGALRRRVRLGIAVALAAAVSVIGTDVFRKYLLHRPVLVRSDSVYPINTFPSGHTATAVACALALVVVSPPAWRGISAVVAGSYAWFTASAVQTAGWHRPSDALGSAFLAFAVVCLLTACVAWKRPIGTGTRFAHAPAFAVLGLVWLGAGAYSAVNALRVLRFLLDHNDSFDPTPAVLNNAYQVSVNLTVVVVVSLLAAMLLLLGRSDLDEPAA